MYTSLSTNLVPGQIDTNGLEDVYLYDRLADANVLVSHAADNPVRTGGSRSQTNYTGGSVSDDGRFVSFISHASNLVAGFVDGNGVGVLQSDVFLFDRLTGSVTLVSHTAASPMTGGNGGSDVATISGDGRFVAFLSRQQRLGCWRNRRTARQRQLQPGVCVRPPDRSRRAP